MKIMDGIKFGFGFTIGSALSGVIAKCILDWIGGENKTDTKKTEE